MSIDPRALSFEKIDPPAPLPHVSRRALARVPHPMAIPSTCRYCADDVELVENSVIYNGRTYGDWPYAYWCGGCNAYIGLHPDTDLPLGTLADKRTREARNSSKKAFNDIWKDGHMTRTQAYAWLARKMGLGIEQCHFGLFEPQQCEAAKAICVNFFSIPLARRHTT